MNVLCARTHTHTHTHAHKYMHCDTEKQIASDSQVPVIHTLVHPIFFVVPSGTSSECWYSAVASSSITLTTPPAIPTAPSYNSPTGDRRVALTMSASKWMAWLACRQGRNSIDRSINQSIKRATNRNPSQSRRSKSRASNEQRWHSFTSTARGQATIAIAAMTTTTAAPARLMMMMIFE